MFEMELYGWKGGSLAAYAPLAYSLHRFSTQITFGSGELLSDFLGFFWGVPSGTALAPDARGTELCLSPVVPPQQAAASIGGCVVRRDRRGLDTLLT